MVDNDVIPPAEAGGPFRNPWPCLITALTTTLVALAVESMVGTAWGWLPFVLVAIGVLAAGIGVAIRPNSAVVLGFAALIALIASVVGPKQEWDSARLVLRVLAVLAATGAVLLLCSTPVRRAVVSVLIVVHFCGILSAVTSPDQSWLANQAWTYIYRPYLQFMYLNNAYRFYSPEPGPASLLWFCIEYEPNPDGSRNLRWVKVPAMDKDGNHIRPDDSRLWPNVEYTRRLSLAESTSFPGPSIWNIPNADALITARDQEADRKHLPSLRKLNIPLDFQYREPNDLSKKWIAQYARHVAHNYRHQTKPDLDVIGVKVYKVLHVIISPAQLAEGMEPDDPTLYAPYYMGEFDKDGNMKPWPACQTLEWDPDAGVWKVAKTPDGGFQRDGLLYWWIPIRRESNTNSDPTQAPSFQQKPTNYVLRHAGDVDGGDLP
jgi:hypothetical protein